MPPADPDAPSPPHECALATALPLSREAFEADLQAGARMDYSRNQILLGRSVARAWEEDGQPLVRLTQDLACAAAGLGVLVCRTPTLESVAALFRARPIVTLVAHWKGAELRRADFRDEPARLVDLIRRGNDDLSRTLVRRLGRIELDAALGKGSAGERAGALAELLNRSVIDTDDPLPGCVGPSRELVYRPWLRLQHRRMLDEAFPDLLWPGNRIELRDGLHAPSAIAARMDNDWAGVVDLALCHSAAAAHIIKAGRTERRIAFNHNEVVPQVRLRILRELYCRLASGGRNYIAELAWIIRSLRDLPVPPHA